MPKKKGKRAKWIKRRCLFCNNLFMTSRHDACFDSARCRKAHNRGQRPPTFTLRSAEVDP